MVSIDYITLPFTLDDTLQRLQKSLENPKLEDICLSLKDKYKETKEKYEKASFK